MAAKKIVKKFMVTAIAGAASPKPPLGPMLGQNGINISAFVQEFNGKTADMAKQFAPAQVKVPAMISLYIDKTFDVDVMAPVTSSLIAWKAKTAKGSGTPNSDKKGSITQADLREIAEIKASSMNTEDIDVICKTIAGTAKNMGVEIKN